MFSGKYILLKKKERKKINYRAIWQIKINYRANYLTKDQCHEEKKRVKNLRIENNNNYRIDLPCYILKTSKLYYRVFRFHHYQIKQHLLQIIYS